MVTIYYDDDEIVENESFDWLEETLEFFRRQLDEINESEDELLDEDG